VESDVSGDPLTIYLREIANIKPLTKDEETRLFQQLGHWGNSDEQAEIAARRLIESQLPLVVSIAERHWSSGIPMLDLIQEGNIGLMNAVKTFTERPIDDFSAHSTACVEGAIAKLVAKSK